MVCENQMYLIDQKFYQDLIIRESEAFYHLFAAIKLKITRFFKPILSFYHCFPHVLDILSYLLFRLKSPI